MKLDFSMLTSPTAKSGGQVGTQGTPAFTTLSASPEVSPIQGKSGDRLVASNNLVPEVSPAVPDIFPEMGTLQSSTRAMSPPSPAVPIKNEMSELERELFEERAAIMEFDGGLLRQEAEKMAYDTVIPLKFGR